MVAACGGDPAAAVVPLSRAEVAGVAALAALCPSAVAMTLPKSVLSASVSSTSAALGVLDEAAALVAARGRVLPRVCADGPVVFCAEDVLPSALPGWPPPLAAPVPWAEPPLLPEPASLAWLAALLPFGLSAAGPAAGPGARA